VESAAGTLLSAPAGRNVPAGIFCFWARKMLANLFDIHSDFFLAGAAA